MYAWHLGCFILKILKGKLFSFRGELASDIQTWKGLPMHIAVSSCKTDFLKCFFNL